MRLAWPLLSKFFLWISLVEIIDQYPWITLDLCHLDLYLHPQQFPLRKCQWPWVFFLQHLDRIVSLFSSVTPKLWYSTSAQPTGERDKKESGEGWHETNELNSGCVGISGEHRINCWYLFYQQVSLANHNPVIIHAGVFSFVSIKGKQWDH